MIKNKIEWLIFDFGGVLVELHTAEMLVALSELGQLPVDRAKEFLNLNEIKLAIGQETPAEFISKFENFSDQKLRAAEFCSAFCTQLGAEMLGTVNLLEASRQHAKIACLSNTNKIHWDHIEQRYSFLSNFERIFTSHELGLRKPDQRIFSAVTSALGVPSKNLLFIDDLEANALAARQAGWQAIHFIDPSQCEEELRAYGLLDSV